MKLLFRAIFIAILGLAFQSSAIAQERWEPSLDSSCHFFTNPTVDSDIYTFESNDEAINVIKKIADIIGVFPNFVIKAANVPNAAAVVDSGDRYILYSQIFMKRIRQENTDWAAWAVMAHEVGHHLNGHTLDGLGSRPDKELEADSFAGFAVHGLGGTLDDALSVFRTMSPAGSSSHPPRSARLEAVASGYNKRVRQSSPAPATGTSSTTKETVSVLSNPDDDCSDGTSCFSIAYNYYKGEQGSQDFGLAKRFFQRSCSLGSPTGCLNVGAMYFRGEGIAQNYPQALLYFERACKGGDMDGCNRAAMVLESDKYGVQDYSRALSFYKTGCDKENKRSCFRAGIMYSNAEGVPDDEATAIGFYKLACKFGMGSACRFVGVMYKYGDGNVQIDGSLVPGYFTRAAILLREQCKSDDSFACYNLALMYKQGDGFVENLITYKDYNMKACRLGYDQACKE